MQMQPTSVLFRVLRTAIGGALALALWACATPDSTSTTAPPVAAIGSSAAPLTQAAGVAREPVRVRLIGINDFHGNLEPTGLNLSLADPAKPGARVRVPTGGAAAVAGLVRALRAQAPYSFFISAGDMVGAAPLVSTMFRHESTIEVMSRIGLDVGTPGNHEFDAGSIELQRLLSGGCATNAPSAPAVSCALRPALGAKFPLVSANVVQADGTPLFAPAWVASVGPYSIGVIGAVTRTTPQMVVASGVRGLSFLDEADAINRAVVALQARGVNALVVTMHEGGETGEAGAPLDWNDESCPGFRGAIVDLAKRISPAVDVILTGHTHQGYRCVIDGRPVMQAVSYGRGLSVADIVIDPRTGRVDRSATRSRNLPVLNAFTDAALREALATATPEPWGQALRDAKPAADIAALVAEYSAAAAPRAERVVGRAVGNFDRSGKTDSSAGRLIADAQWAYSRDPGRGGAELALMNPGGIRTDLPCRKPPSCEVSFGEVFTMQPFGNSVVVMSLSGAELKALLESQHKSTRDTPHFLSPSGSLRYRWLANAPVGDHVRDLQIAGAPVDPKRDYRVAVNSFLAEGGDGFLLLRAGRDRLGGGQDVEALAEWLKTNPTPISTPRIEWVE